MSIVLVDTGAEPGTPELSFSKDVVVLGRDPDCDVRFERAKAPMVSRRHAELRHAAGAWTLVDAGSSYGVFLNDETLTAPAEVNVGDRIRLGPDGPLLLVLWAEPNKPSVSEPGRSPAPAPEPQPQAINEPHPQPPPPLDPVAQPVVDRRPSSAADRGPTPADPPPPHLAHAARDVQVASPHRPEARPILSVRDASPSAMVARGRLIFIDDPSRSPAELGSETVTLGRAVECAVTFDEADQMVSRMHAVISFDGRGFVVTDNQSFNGTLVNGERVDVPTPLRTGDVIRLGPGGPSLRFVVPDPNSPEPRASDMPPVPQASRSIAKPIEPPAAPIRPSEASDGKHLKTMVVAADGSPKIGRRTSVPRGPELVATVDVAGKQTVTLGRDASCDIRLDSLQVSKQHARLVLRGDTAIVEDTGSTNGVSVNGGPVSRHEIAEGETLEIGPFQLIVDRHSGVRVYDTRSRCQLDVVDVSRRAGGGFRRGTAKDVLSSVSFSVSPNEVVGVLGTSGSGKTMLLEAMAGIATPSAGSVLVNGREASRADVRSQVGYVPQDDVIHRELSVFRTLYHIARLRLARDASAGEVRELVENILVTTGLSGQRDLPVRSLSGGQRKRVSIAAELVTQPSVLLLDEPGAGLDAGSEARMLEIFRRLAEQGTTVVMSTHTLENVEAFDRIAILSEGQLVFFGRPAEALSHFGVKRYAEIYRLLDPAAGGSTGEHAARFKESSYYLPPGARPEAAAARSGRRARAGIIGSIRQWGVLSKRYLELLFRDKLTLAILVLQAPVIAVLTALAVPAEHPRDLVYLVPALCAMWFGVSVSARELVREREIFRRERRVGLGLLPYLGSKFFVLGVLVFLQCLFLFVPMKLLHAVGAMPMPGELWGVPQFWTMLLTAAVGIALGLLVSSIVRTSEMATGLVPLLLIPQLLLSGIAGTPAAPVYKAVMLPNPSAWSFDTMKRFSTLDTLDQEGADPNGRTRGMGLYRSIEDDNRKIAEKAREDLDAYLKLLSDGSRGSDVPKFNADDIAIKKLPADLSGYVTFKHPWMGEILNQVLLVVMFWFAALATIVVMRARHN